MKDNPPPDDPEPRDCANCGAPIRRTTPDDGIDGGYLWTHIAGGLYCDIGPPVASPGGGYGW